MARGRSDSDPPVVNNGPQAPRPRSGSDPNVSATGQPRPETLYFYCTAADHADIVRDHAIWVIGGVPAPPANTAHGAFPPGAYASSSQPSVVRARINDFVTQWYGGFQIVLTHYVEFTNEPGWQPEGHNLAPNTAAQFGWHWVNPHNDRHMTRQGNDRQAVGIQIKSHGPF